MITQSGWIQLFRSLVFLGLILSSILSKAATITVMSGDNQSGPVNSTLPNQLVVSVDCTSFAPNFPSPPPCGTIEWSSSEPGDSFSPQSSSTLGSPGNAQSSTMLTLGPVPGVRTIFAVSNTLDTSTSFTITATAAGPSQPPSSSPSSTPSPVNPALIQQQTQALSQAAALPRSSLLNVTNGNSNVTSHLNGFHSRGMRDLVDLSELKFDVDGNRFSAADLRSMLLSDSGGGAGDSDGFLDGRLSFYLNGNFHFGDRPTSSRETGFDFDIQGSLLGLDYWLLENLYTGIAFGYDGTQNDYYQSAGEADIDTYSLNVYASWNQIESFYLDALFRYGWSDYEASRNFTNAGSRQTAEARYDGTDYSFAVNAGYQFSFGEVSLQPYTRFEYITVETDSYRETAKTSGAAPYLLSVSGQRLESIRTALGGRINYAISSGVGVFVPSLELEWVHEYENNSRILTSSLINLPSVNSVSLATDSPDRDFLNLGASVSGVFPYGLSGFLSYRAQLANRLIFQQTVNLGLRVEL